MLEFSGCDLMQPIICSSVLFFFFFLTKDCSEKFFISTVSFIFWTYNGTSCFFFLINAPLFMNLPYNFGSCKLQFYWCSSLLQSKLYDTHHKLHNARTHNKLRNFWHNSSRVASCEWWRCGLIWIYYFFFTTRNSLSPHVKLWEKLYNLLCF